MSPRDPELSQRMREGSIAKIVESSLDLFSRKGFYATSMSEVAANAGVSKGLAYSYFRSKDDLVLEAIRRRLDHLTDLVETVGDIDDPRERLDALIGRFIEDVERNPAAFRLYFSLILQEESSTAFREAVHLFQGRVDRYLESILHTITELGSPDPEADLLLFRSTLLGLSFRIALSPESVLIDRARRRLMELVMSGPVQK